MENFNSKVIELLEDGGDKKYSVLEGTVAKAGSRDAVQVAFMENGNMRVNANLLMEESYTTRGGDTRTSKYFANLVAFGNMAESMSGVKEGDRLRVITKRSSRKFKERWYENDEVIYFQKV